AAFEIHRRQAARERTRAFDSVVNEPGDALDLRQDRRVLAREPAGGAPAHQRDASQLLAETVVEIVADAVLLAIHSLQDRALQLLALAHVLHHNPAVTSARQRQARG